MLRPMCRVALLTARVTVFVRCQSDLPLEIDSHERPLEVGSGCQASASLLGRLRTQSWSSQLWAAELKVVVT